LEAAGAAGGRHSRRPQRLKHPTNWAWRSRSVAWWPSGPRAAGKREEIAPPTASLQAPLRRLIPRIGHDLPQETAAVLELFRGVP